MLIVILLKKRDKILFAIQSFLRLLTEAWGVIVMMLGEVFERFVAESPVTMMLSVLLEQSLAEDEVDRLCEHQAQRQYECNLLFSTVVSLCCFPRWSLS